MRLWLSVHVQWRPLTTREGKRVPDLCSPSHSQWDSRSQQVKYDERSLTSDTLGPSNNPSASLLCARVPLPSLAYCTVQFWCTVKPSVRETPKMSMLHYAMSHRHSSWDTQDAWQYGNSSLEFQEAEGMQGSHGNRHSYAEHSKNDISIYFGHIRLSHWLTTERADRNYLGLPFQWSMCCQTRR